jgi:hypothetical protein
METNQQEEDDHPILGLVNLNELDAEGQRHMDSLILAGVQFGAGIAGFEKLDPVARLSEAIGKRLVDGTASERLAVDDLCMGRTGTGRVRDAFVEPLRDVADLATRAILARSGRTAIHEWIASLSVRAGGESHAIGVDREPNVGTRAHVLLGAIGASDRQLVCQAEWLKTGTRDDHSCERADPARIAEFAAQLDHPVPGPLHEHLRRTFEAEDRARNRVERAAEEGSPWFARCEIDPERFLKNCFPTCLILGDVPYGPPMKRGEDCAAVLRPGDEGEVAEVVREAGRHAVARCDLGRSRIPLRALDDILLDELGDRFGERPQPVEQAWLDSVATWPVAAELGVADTVPLVRYWQLEESSVLLRSMQVSGPDGGEVLDVSLFRLINLEGPLLRAAITLIERAHLPWPFSCIARFGRELEPGLAQTRKPVPREGLLRTSLIPNAAGVCAHRGMQQRRLGR